MYKPMLIFMMIFMQISFAYAEDRKPDLESSPMTMKRLLDGISIGMTKQDVKELLVAKGVKDIKEGTMVATGMIVYTLEEELKKEIPESEEVVVDILYCGYDTPSEHFLDYWPLIFYKDKYIGGGWNLIIYNPGIPADVFKKQDRGHEIDTIYQEIRKKD